MKKKKFLYQATADDIFNPANPAHRGAYKDFFARGNWRDGCPFMLEPPYQSVPNMCRERLLNWYLNTDTRLEHARG